MTAIRDRIFADIRTTEDVIEAQTALDCTTTVVWLYTAAYEQLRFAHLADPLMAMAAIDELLPLRTRPQFLKLVSWGEFEDPIQVSCSNEHAMVTRISSAQGEVHTSVYWHSDEPAVVMTKQIAPGQWLSVVGPAHVAKRILGKQD